ncbi:family 79 putative glycoside hydrolase [Podospora aff. communis PSN243]|uniref:Family 79 putative glycoside hydrolase n=1 Tax=Podospora aff. communis PSN243 TaxID=3040156 RepID=A0AAV9H3Z6_9PEZI|nr:family 79 putative glycoside hydrolase [Podospora aff. communis PSN243]
MKRLAGTILAISALGRGQSLYNVSWSGEPGNDVFDSFMSYSIEFSSFPDFAGNISRPNKYSDILLQNIADIMGSKPYIRVGGNTQDYALYNASLPFALNGTYDLRRSPDYPTTIFIGPSYFESYDTWDDVKFSHGLNLGLGGNNSAGWQTLLDTVPLVCKALRGKLYIWQYGNEPDLFSTSTHGIVRPPSWNEKAYVEQWQNGTRTIKSLIQDNCPGLLDYGFLAPAFAGVGNRLKAPVAWAAGLNSNNDIPLFSTHNYISGAESPGVTLQSTLMNHTNTVRSIAAHVTEYQAILRSDASAPPPIFGEHNSLYNQGRPGLSNTFGAALWGLDFNLYAASAGFKRVHMHQGTNYRYASWQPISTPNATLGTKAPYYGNIAVAAAFGNTIHSPASVLSLPSHPQQDKEAVYAIYTQNGSALTRIVIINFHSYNTTVDGAGIVPVFDPPPRPTRNFTFALSLPNATDTTPSPSLGSLRIQRLMAKGTDAITGITWDGWSYNYELDGGRPVRLGNVTVDETVEVEGGGLFTVDVPDGSAVLVHVDDSEKAGGYGGGVSGRAVEVGGRGNEQDGMWCDL